MSIIEVFTTMTISFSILCLLIGLSSFDKKGKLGKWLGICSLFIMSVLLSYLISITSSDYFIMSFFMSLYSISIDLCLISLLVLIHYFTQNSMKYWKIVIYLVFIIYLLIDIIILFTNPFNQIAFSFYKTSYGLYKYIRYPLFDVHLIYTYLLVIFALYELLYKATTVPKAYRQYYVNTINIIIFVIVINAVYLYLPLDSWMEVFEVLDFSIWGYVFVLITFYWDCFEYTQGKMTNTYNKWIVNNINQGVVIFDYDDNVVVKNEQFMRLFGLRNNVNIKAAFKSHNLKLDEFGSNSVTYQFHISDVSGIKPVKFEYHPILEDSSLIGKMFVFTELSVVVDELTGYELLKHFNNTIGLIHQTLYSPIIACVFDINSLGVINHTFGRDVGDECIYYLSKLIKNTFISKTYFVRGNEAQLIAITYGLNDSTTISRCNNVIKQFNSYYAQQKKYFTCQFSTAVSDDKNANMVDLIAEADMTLINRKTLDNNSTKSDYLNSLMNALQQCDKDTQDHVIRTRVLGEKLGKRLNLTPYQQSQLALLCMVHDIGKIGIPLEILNKPDKLNEKEWELVKTHADKGYKICLNSSELKDVANEVLHHHERWDGYGYPNGLSQTSIPILSRVIAVVDAFDAMINNRVYRKALSVTEAVNELKRNAGKQFDPTIVSEFLDMISLEYDLINNEVTEIQNETKEIETVDNETIDDPLYVREIVFTRYVLDSDWNILEVDDNFESITGYSKDDVKEGLTQLDLIPQDEREYYISSVYKATTKNNLVYFEHHIKHKDGSVYYYFCSGRTYFDPITHNQNSEIVLVDITKGYIVNALYELERRRYNTKVEQWEDRYRHEPLTGLLTREAFMNDVDSAILKGDCCIMMLYLDVNDFKKLNDTYGHLEGDKALIKLAESLKTVLRKKDVSARMGGDEFACALFYPLKVSKTKMVERAKDIYNQISANISNSEIPFTISLGVAIQSEKINTFNKLYAVSDKALYNAKKTSDNFYYDEELINE